MPLTPALSPHAGGGRAASAPRLALLSRNNVGGAGLLRRGRAGGAPVAKRLPVGNLLNRLTGCMIGLVALDWAGPLLVAIEPDLPALWPISTVCSTSSRQRCSCPCSARSRESWFACYRRERYQRTRRARSISTRPHARRRP